MNRQKYKEIYEISKNTKHYKDSDRILCKWKSIHLTSGSGEIGQLIDFSVQLSETFHSKYEHISAGTHLFSTWYVARGK